MIKKIKIESITRYDHTCGYGEYLYTPVNFALKWILAQIKISNSISVVNFKQEDKEHMIVKLKGKRVDINNILAKFTCAYGDKFNIH